MKGLHKKEVNPWAACGVAIIGTCLLPLLAIAPIWLVFGAIEGFGYPRTRTLEFQDSGSVGDLRLLAYGECRGCADEDRSIGKAIGTVQTEIPAKYYDLSLVVSPTGVNRLSQLQNMAKHKLEKIDFSETSITDDQLQYIQHFNLDILDLSNTAVTGEGLSNFKPFYKRTHIYLTGQSKLADTSIVENFDEFRWFSRVSSLSISPSE